jgi:hypothetical protein
VKLSGVRLVFGNVEHFLRRAVGWVYKNASSFGGDASRLYIGGHSSGGHLCGVTLVTDWQTEFGLPSNIIKGALCMSGLYDMKAVRLSKRSSYVNFTDEMEQAMSSQRHLDLLRAPVTITYGTNGTPEFQRQSRDFAAAVRAVGKPVELIEAANYNHFEMEESLGNPYGPKRTDGARVNETLAELSAEPPMARPLWGGCSLQRGLRFATEPASQCSGSEAKIGIGRFGRKIALGPNVRIATNPATFQLRVAFRPTQCPIGHA